MMHDTTFRSRRTLGAIGAIAFLIAACGSSGGGPTTAATQPAATGPAATGPAATQAEATGAAQAHEVELADNDTLGKYLVGEDGKTLYLFTPDTTSASNCNGDCAASWPPFTLEDGETVKGGDGVTGTFATIARQDGSMQVTYAGHPLYYYGADTAAGDTNGQGLFDKWYLVGADGTAIMGTTSSGGKGNY